MNLANSQGAHRTRRAPAPELIVRALVAVGLAVDAAVHFALASDRPPAPPDGGLSQITLFYAEGVVATVAALILVFTGARWAFAVAFLVAASALGAVLLYRYVNVGALGPLPNMYEPLWSLPKVVTTIAEAVAVVAALIGFAFRARWRRGSNQAQS